MAEADPQYPQDAERSDGTVEPDENDNSSDFGVAPVSSQVAHGSPGEPEPAGRE